MNILKNFKKFFAKSALKKEGIRFSCTQCGYCCIKPGSVFFSRDEIKKAAELLKTTVKSFKHKYITEKIHDNLYELYTKSACPFYNEDAGCVIYKARPSQCSTYPFWPNNFQNEKTIQKLFSECPGTGRGKFHSYEKIAENIAKTHERSRY